MLVGKIGAMFEILYGPNNVVWLTRSQRNSPPFAFAAPPAIIEQDIIATCMIEKLCPGQHINTRSLETMHENNRRGAGRSNRQPTSQANAIRCCEMHLLNREICGGSVGNGTARGVCHQDKSTNRRYSGP